MVKTDTEKQTEDKIFDAALAVFEEKGFAAARMQEIADRAGINKALLHYYFRSKDHLFDAVFDKRLGDMFSKIFGVFMSDKPFEEKIREYYSEHISFFEKNPRLPNFIISEIALNPAMLAKRFSKIDYAALRDVVMEKNGKELAGYNIGKEDWPQLMVTIISLTVFPFAAQEIIKVLLPRIGATDDFNKFMNDRKSFASDFVMNSLKYRKKI
jgi:TetR/AcrR family transcriptional regulator